jgi:hypothetical protein
MSVAQLSDTSRVVMAGLSRTQRFALSGHDQSRALCPAEGQIQEADLRSSFGRQTNTQSRPKKYQRAIQIRGSVSMESFLVKGQLSLLTT